MVVALLRHHHSLLQQQVDFVHHRPHNSAGCDVHAGYGRVPTHTVDLSGEQRYGRTFQGWRPGLFLSGVNFERLFLPSFLQNEYAYKLNMVPLATRLLMIKL